MSSTASATLAGVPLDLDGSIRWGLRVGVEPYTNTFHTSRASGNTLMDVAGAPVDLAISDGNGRSITYQNLWILGLTAGPTPETVGVRVADRRWMWSRKHVRRHYNVHRKAGVKRVGDLKTPELLPVVADVQFAVYSLRDYTRLSTALEILRDCLEDAFSVEEDFAGGSWELHATNDALTLLNGRKPQNVILDLSAPSALRRVLAKLADIDLYLDRAGDVRVKLRGAGDDLDVLSAVQPGDLGSGHVEVVSKANEAPIYIDCLFSREVEVRFDFVEDTETETAPQPDDRRRADNVLSVPDFSIEIGGESVAQGTWLSFARYLAAIDPPPGAGRRIDNAFFRRAFMPFKDLWGPLQQAGLDAPDVDWVARAGAFQEHWRNSYRINRRWMDRIIALRPYLVATIDPVSGQRSPAFAFGNYCRLGGQKFFWKQPQNDQMALGINVEGYTEIIGENTKPMPAELVIRDGDQGILGLAWKNDPIRQFETTLPGLIDAETMPSADASIGRTVAFNAVIRGRKPPQLAAGHKIAFLLTAIPAANHFHRIRVTAADVMPLLPTRLAGSLNGAKGPPREIRIGAGVETARVRWLDARRDDIEKLFGVGAAPDDEPPDVDDLTVNLGEQDDLSDALGAASITAIARAAAARAYAAYVSRPEGQMRSGALGVDPLGWLDAVEVTVGPDGLVSSNLDWPEVLPELPFEELLPDSARAIILREAQKRN